MSVRSAGRCAHAGFLERRAICYLGCHRPAVIVYAVVDDALSPDFRLGVELVVFVRREDTSR